jgi:hypothetical protein
MTENTQNLPNVSNTFNTKEKKTHDPLPIKLNFTKEGLDTKFFFKRIKPSEGVVKYDLTTWPYFPADIESAKQLAKSVSKDFSTNKKYNGYIINVFFHMDKKTIRFEIKKYKTLETISIKLEDITSTEQLEQYLELSVESNVGIYLYELPNYVFPEIDGCKESGKNISLKLESKFNNRKYVVFFNPKAKTLKLTIRDKITKLVRNLV